MADYSNHKLDLVLQREGTWRRWMWISALLPFGVFIALLVMAGKERRTLDQLVTRVQQLREERARLEHDLSEADLASKAMKSRPGPHPIFRYYRKDPRITGALQRLGVSVPDIQEDSPKANPGLANKQPDTLAYGCAVSEEDLRLIAATLIEAGIPIRRIGPASLNQDALLVQLVASARSDETKPSIDPKKWTKSTPTCSDTRRASP